MNIKKRITGIWLMAMALLSLGAYTTFFVAQMWLNVLHVFYLTLMTMQFITLIIYLWGSEKIKSRLMRLVYRAFYASSLLVIPSFAFIFMGLVSQYHVKLAGAVDARRIVAGEIVPAGETTVYNTGAVYVIFPEYSEIELVCENRPSKSDTSITWCSGAAFQHTVSLGFTQENVEGDHAVKGALYESPYNKKSFAAFTFSAGNYSFEFDDPTGAIRDAADAGGSGFMQFGLIRDGEIVMKFDRPRARCYRALAELNDHVCIIDSVNMLHFDEFLAELQRLGVTNALYMDMGAGWNYSWYRDTADRVVTLFGLPVPWSHNWIAFRKGD